MIGLVFLLSLVQTKIYLFWHGGQKPVGFPYRFSFIIIFWILLLAAKELAGFDLKEKQLLLASGIYFVVGLFSDCLKTALWKIRYVYVGFAGLNYFV